MTQNDERDFDFTEELESAPVSDATTEVDEVAADKQTYQLKNGSEGTRAAYIRELFLEDNLSRKQISEAHGFPYRIVYSATVNLTNEAEPSGRGRSVTNPMIEVYGEEKTPIKKDGETVIDMLTGEIVEDAEVVEVPRNEWIKEQVEKGMSRGDIAKALDLSYGVIYNLTREQEGTRSKHTIEMEDGTVMTRSEFIRKEHGEGKSRSEIAKELDVPYSVVWQATKVEKSESDKFAELVEQLKAFTDKVDDTAEFVDILERLELFDIAEAEADVKAAAAAEAEEV